MNNTWILYMLPVYIGLMVVSRIVFCIIDVITCIYYRYIFVKSLKGERLSL